MMETCLKRQYLHFYIPQNGYTRKGIIYGTRSNGVPGLEIHGEQRGLGQLRQKILYLCRPLGRFPLVKFSLTIESESKLQVEDLRFLEVPAMILYLSLASKLKVKALSHCVAAGQIGPTGLVKTPDYTLDDLGQIKELLLESGQNLPTLISADNPGVNRFISLFELVPKELGLSA